MTDREAFEEWAKTTLDLNLAKSSKGAYLYASTNWLWRGWQAAIAHAQDLHAKAVLDLDRQKWFPSQRDFAEACVDAIRKGDAT